MAEELKKEQVYRKELEGRVSALTMTVEELRREGAQLREQAALKPAVQSALMPAHSGAPAGGYQVLGRPVLGGTLRVSTSSPALCAGSIGSSMVFKVLPSEGSNFGSSLGYLCPALLLTADVVKHGKMFCSTGCRCQWGPACWRLAVEPCRWRWHFQAHCRRMPDSGGPGHWRAQYLQAKNCPAAHQCILSWHLLASAKSSFSTRQIQAMPAAHSVARSGRALTRSLLPPRIQ